MKTLLIDLVVVLGSSNPDKNGAFAQAKEHR
jgi:hypothetical protein